MTDPCSICHDGITKATGIATLSCSHSYHLSCIVTWLMTQDKGTCPCCRQEVGPLELLRKKQEEEEGNNPLEDSLGLSNAQLADIIWGLGGYSPRSLLEQGDGTVVYYTHLGIDMYLASYNAAPMSNEEWILRMSMQSQWSIPFPEDIWLFWRSLHSQDIDNADRFIIACEAVGPAHVFEPNYLICVINYLQQIAGTHEESNPQLTEELRTLAKMIHDYVHEKESKKLQITFRTDSEAGEPFNATHTIVET